VGVGFPNLKTGTITRRRIYFVKAVMSPDFVTGFFIEAVKTAIFLAAPCLLFGLVAGVLVAIFQAATQINEMTLVFIPKMLAVGLGLLLFFSWMLRLIVDFTRNVFINIPMYIN
jgi:flagellar biosynthetic protein FliQ